MPNPEEFNLRLSNLISTLEVSKSRADALVSFGSAAELEEIGLLTMRLAALEEWISLICEILLIRPELGGFHAPTKAILTKQLSEKLNLYKALTTASGILYGISTESIEKSIAAVKIVGEDRNTIIHGVLFQRQDSEIAFRGRGREVQATLDELRRLTESCQEAAFDLTTQFSNFYVELVSRKSTHASIEVAVQDALQKWFNLQTSVNTLRKTTLKERDAETAFIHTTRKVQESRERLAVAKKVLRNAGARERRRKKALSRSRVEPGG